MGQSEGADRRDVALAQERLKGEGRQPRYGEGPRGVFRVVAAPALLRSRPMLARSAGPAVAIWTGARTELIGATRRVTASMAAASGWEGSLRVGRARICKRCASS